MNIQQDPISFEKKVILSLKDIRRSKKITQTELAQRIGVSRDTIARIESGKHRIYLAQVIAIAGELNVTLQDLFLEDKQREELDENVSVSQQNVRLSYITPNMSLRSVDQTEKQSPTVGFASAQSPLTIENFAAVENLYLHEPAVEHYGVPMKDFIMNHRLFWHWVPEEKLIDLSVASVVEAVLNDGNEKDVADLFKMVGVRKTAEVFKWGISGFRTNYRENTISFFNAYFRRHVPGYSD